jgi:hypothetical protein
MKANRIINKGIGLLTALVVLLCTLPAAAFAATTQEAFSFRNGITWNTTVDEMLAAEGVDSEEDYEYYDSGYAEMYMFDVDMDGTWIQVAYGFVEDQPVLAAEYFEGEDKENFDLHQTELSQLYGQPTETDAVNAAPLLEALGSEDLDDGLTAIVGWTLADGTRIYLMVMYDEIYTFYFNADRLLAAGDGEDEEEANVVDATFAIRNGITWDTTVEEMLAAEGALSEDDYQVSDADGYTGYLLNAAEGEPQVGYAFRGDQLYMAAIYYQSAPVEDYAAHLSELTALYGEPSETDADHAEELFSEFGFDGLDESLITISGWVLADSTAVYLMIMDDEVYLFYFNEWMLWE